MFRIAFTRFATPLTAWALAFAALATATDTATAQPRTRVLTAEQNTAADQHDRAIYARLLPMTEGLDGFVERTHHLLRRYNQQKGSAKELVRVLLLEAGGRLQSQQQVGLLLSFEKAGLPRPLLGEIGDFQHFVSRGIQDLNLYNPETPASADLAMRLVNALTAVKLTPGIHPHAYERLMLIYATSRSEFVRTQILRRLVGDYRREGFSEYVIRQARLDVGFTEQLIADMASDSLRIAELAAQVVTEFAKADRPIFARETLASRAIERGGQVLVAENPIEWAKQKVDRYVRNPAAESAIVAAGALDLSILLGETTNTPIAKLTVRSFAPVFDQAVLRWVSRRLVNADLVKEFAQAGILMENFETRAQAYELYFRRVAKTGYVVDTNFETMFSVYPERNMELLSLVEGMSRAFPVADLEFQKKVMGMLAGSWRHRVIARKMETLYKTRNIGGANGARCDGALQVVSF